MYVFPLMVVSDSHPLPQKRLSVQILKVAPREKPGVTSTAKAGESVLKLPLCLKSTFSLLVRVEPKPGWETMVVLAFPGTA